MYKKKIYKPHQNKPSLLKPCGEMRYGLRQRLNFMVKTVEGLAQRQQHITVEKHH